MRLRALPAVVALALALGGCAGGDPGDASGEATPSDLTAPRSGGRLPDVRLDALDGGRPLDLGSLRGPVVVNLWASWCGPCKEELPIYADFAERHEGRVDVVGVDYEETSVDAARELARRSGVTYPLYADPEGELRAIALPQLLLVDERGEVALEQYVEITSRGQLESLVREHLGVRL